MARDRYFAGFHGVLLLAMASTRFHDVPSVVFDHPNNISDFQSSSSSVMSPALIARAFASATSQEVPFPTRCAIETLWP